MINWTAVEKLLDQSNKDSSEREAITGRLLSLGEDFTEFEEAEYYLIIEELRESCLDPITHGGNYNQGDILRHLKKLG